MNIFYLDHDPVHAAQYLCNKHIVKMALETCQILHTNLRCKNINDDWLYKPFNPKHPSVQWAAESRQNFIWLIQHGLAICREYAFRYHKSHSCMSRIEQTIHFAHLFPDIPQTPIRLAMPTLYHTDDPVHSYRLYYVNEKRSFAQWGPKRSPPPWWNEYIHNYVVMK